MSLSPSSHDREYEKFRDDGSRGSKVAVTLQGELLSLSSSNKSYLVGEPIAPMRAVYLASGQVFNASNDNFLKSSPIGISLTGANDGAVLVQEHGDVYDSSLIFVIGEPVYLGVNGVVTQSPPISGFRTQLGIAVATNGFRINIGEPIEL